MSRTHRTVWILSVAFSVNAGAVYSQPASLKASKAIMSEGILHRIEIVEGYDQYVPFDLIVKDELGTRKAKWPGLIASAYVYNAMRWDIFDGSIFSISVGYGMSKRTVGAGLHKVSLTEWDSLRFHGAALASEDRLRRNQFLITDEVYVKPLEEAWQDPEFLRTTEQYRPEPVYFDFVIKDGLFHFFMLVDNQISFWQFDGSGWAYSDDEHSGRSGFVPNWQSVSAFPAPFQGPFNVVHQGGDSYLIDDSGGVYQVGSTLNQVCQTTAPLGHGVLLVLRDLDQVIFIPEDEFDLDDLDASLRNGIMLLPLLTPSVSDLSPEAASPGSGDFTLMISGSSFPNGSTVQWNGSPRVTTFISSTQLEAAITAADVAAEGTANVAVVSPCGAASNGMTFTIAAAPAENILSVPSQYATIQAAVDAAQPGDVVEVSPGFYDERVSVSDKDSITVRTTGGINEVTCKGFLLKQSHQITIKGFVVDVAGTSEHGIVLMGGNNQNSDVTLEANEIKNAGNDFSGISIARGNPRTRIANNRIHDNGRNGIRIIDATGGPHYLINNTIVLNGWNGVDVARQHVIYLVNNVLSFNGTKPGSTGGRYGVSREGMTGPGEASGITLLNNLIVGNNGKVTANSSQDLGNYAQTLDSTDARNFTTAGNEGSGVSASPSSVFADIFVSQTPLDLHLKATSVAINRGLNSYSAPDAEAGAIPTHDYEDESRPQGAAVDLGMDERP